MADRDSDPTGGGIGLGAVIAVILSYQVNHSVGWALLHGMLGWAYVIARFAGCADGGAP